MILTLLFKTDSYIVPVVVEPEKRILTESLDRQYDVRYNYIRAEVVEETPTPTPTPMPIPVPTSITTPVPVVYPYPEYIIVGVTGLKECETGMRYRSKTVPFKDYVKGVMVNEWGHNWHEESLKAGAVAIKMYAWNAVLKGKWISVDVFDCDWDMVYNPAITRDSTDKAVDDTWEYALFFNDTQQPYHTYFNAWYGGCMERELVGSCMGQWNSKADAENGMLWQDILYKYYLNSEVVNVQ